METRVRHARESKVMKDCGEEKRYIHQKCDHRDNDVCQRILSCSYRFTIHYSCKFTI